MGGDSSRKTVGGREAGDGTPCLISELTLISSTNLKLRFSFFAFTFSSSFERREADARINALDFVQCEGHVMGIIVSTDANDPTSSLTASYNIPQARILIPTECEIMRLNIENANTTSLISHN
jgi:hypothetical protein